MDALVETTRPRRELCPGCLRAPVGCYCAHVRRFDPSIDFAILMHQREAHKHVATGRLAHRCLEGSHLLPGYDWSRDETVRTLLADPARVPAVLFPGESSVNLSRLAPADRAALVPRGKRLTVFVIDGTWSTARKTMERTPLLAALPRLSFDPTGPSRIRIRLQPRPECLTTLEAIHHVIELLGPAAGFDASTRAHDGMLSALDAMVERQMELARARAGRPAGPGFGLS